MKRVFCIAVLLMLCLGAAGAEQKKTLADYGYYLSANDNGEYWLYRQDDPRYPSYVGYFENAGEGLAPVLLGTFREYGYINAAGEVVIAPQFDKASYFYEGLAEVEINDRVGFIDSNGEFVIEPQFYLANGFHDGCAAAAIRGDLADFSGEKEYEGIWGVINRQGEWIVEPQFDYVDDFSEGVAVVRFEGEEKYDYTYAYINTSGEFIIDQYFDYAQSFENGMAQVEIDDKCGLLALDGTYIVEPSDYIMMNPFVNGYAPVAVATGVKVDISDFDEGVNMWGLIDMQGRVVIEPQYDYLELIEGYAGIVVKKDGKYGMVDIENNIILPFEYDYITGAEEGDGSYITAEGGPDGTVYFAMNDPSLKPIAHVGSTLNMLEYYPHTGAKVAVLDEAAQIAWDETAPLPALDGATALFPVYSAFAQAAYPEDVRYDMVVDGKVLVTCTKTNQAYRNLISGEADVIFCAGPSDAQIEAAAAAGVEFELTPFGKEAFVFIVNKDNPMDNIRVDQIRQVYSGEITQWEELGVNGLGDIVAYQRPADSGSQTALERLMGDVPLMVAPQNVEWDMGDIIETIEYRNLPNAIGYTFRFFCTDMIGSQVKLLAIDGVAPTVENIRSGSYPICSTLYAVTRKGEDNPNVRILLNWVQGSQGAELIEKSGYVSRTE